MEKTLNLLFTLAIMSPQLWAAEPAAPGISVVVAAAAAEAETKSKTENDDNYIMSKIREIILNPSNNLRVEDWDNDIHSRILPATNCGNSAMIIIKELGFERDIVSSSNELIRGRRTSLPEEHYGAYLDFIAKKEENYIHPLAQSLFNNAQENEHALYYIAIDTFRHIFLVETLNTGSDNHWAKIFQSWAKVCTVSQWLNIDAWHSSELYNPCRIEMPFYTELYNTYGKNQKLNPTQIKIFVQTIVSSLGKRRGLENTIYVRKFNVSSKKPLASSARAAIDGKDAPLAGGAS